MCTGLFSCMDQKHVVLRKHISQMGDLLEERPEEGRGLSKLLSLADILSRVAAETEGASTPKCGNDLSDVTAMLYEVTGQLFDDPKSSRRWQNLRRQHRVVRQVFERELERLRHSCAEAGLPAPG